MAESTPRKTTNNREGKKANRESFSTHTGHALTPLEAKFIDEYIATGNGSKAVETAGYKCKSLPQQAQKLLNKPAWSVINRNYLYILRKIQTTKDMLSSL